MPKRILVMCKGNTCRSPMVAALLSEHFRRVGDNMSVIESAGYHKNAAGSWPAAPEWNELADETRIDLTKHQSRWIMDIAYLGQYDRVVCVDADAVELVKARGVPEEHILVIDVPNPWEKDRPLEEGVPVYRDCYYEIKRTVLPKIVAWL